MTSYDDAIVLLDSDDEVGGASPTSTTSASSSSSSHSNAPGNSSTGVITGRSSPPSSSSDSRTVAAARPARVNPTTLPQSEPRKQVQRLSSMTVDEQAKMEEQAKEAINRRQQQPADSARRPNTARALLPVKESSPASSPCPPAAAESGGSIKNDMTFVPHPNAVTHATEYITAEGEGKPAQAYALCEFIDNALTALRKSKEAEQGMEPEIKLLFVEPTGEFSVTKKLFILIRSSHSLTCHALAARGERSRRRALIPLTHSLALFAA